MWLSNIHCGSNFRFKALNPLLKRNNLWYNGFIKRGPDPCLPLIRRSNYLNPTLVSTALSTQPSFTVISALAVNVIWIKKNIRAIQACLYNCSTGLDKKKGPSHLSCSNHPRSRLWGNVRPSSHLSKEQNSVKTIWKDGTLWVCIILFSAY